MKSAAAAALGLVLSLMLTAAAWAAAEESMDTQVLISALSPKLPVKFCNETVPLSNQEVKERFEKEMLLILWDQPQVLLWLKRAHRYFPEIETLLSKANMPDDLKFLPIVESALRPHAGSTRGAVGFWQLMPETARKYGLRVDNEVDQRRAISASTRAALAYIQELYERLQSWTLAMAAYNMGEEGLIAEMLEQDTRDFYKLYLSLETQRFVLRIVAAKLIMTEPQRYGFHLSEKDYYSPLKYDTITLDTFDDAPLRLVAKAANTDFKVIKDLNPELRGHYLSPGSRLLRLPENSSQGFLERFRQLVEAHSREFKQRIYIVKPGDNLSIIADRFKVPLAALLIWNRLTMNQPIHPGDRLVVSPHKDKKN